MTSGGHSIFASLNENQSKALEASNDSLLQIIAGPGTGKTKLLVSRVAYLLLHFRLPPSGIIVTTFTKKAANEMKDRLSLLLENHPDQDLKKLQIGTFHSICFGYLRFYGRVVGLESNFKIADNKDQRDLMLKALSILDLDDIKADKASVKTVQKYISNNKSLGFHPQDILLSDIKDALENQYYQVYVKYQELLKKNSMIDFDDILIFTDKLLTVRPECVSHVKHILVDEFQDTNTIQLQLIFKFSRFCNDNITIVGDADQSIYGFRNATYTNFQKMEEIALQRKRTFVKITLNQNYRSTDSILKLSEQLMRNQNARDDKNLLSSKSSSSPVYYIKHQLPADESIFFAERIKKLIHQDDNPYTYKDFAVIVRVSRTFLSLEKEMSRKGIPYRIVKGHSFWELREISMMVDCLRIIAFDDWLSYKRVIDWFAVGCGAKLIEKIESSILVPEIPEFGIFSIIKEYAGGIREGATSKGKDSLMHLLTIVEECRAVSLTESNTDFFNFVAQKFSVLDNALKKKSGAKDEEEMKYDITENLSELKAQFKDYDPAEDELLRETQEEVFRNQEHSLSVAIQIKQEEPVTQTGPSNKVLCQFLDHIYLAESVSSDEKEGTEDSQGKVTLTTIHGAKGLEWPVVFIPSLVNNILPSRFALAEVDPVKKESLLDEERRCLYVALTRAKDLLFLSTYQSDQNLYQQSSPSCFLQEIPETYYTDISPKFMSDLHVSRAAFSNSFRNPLQTSKPNLKFTTPNSKSLPSVMCSSKKEVESLIGKSGTSYNPVTGAVLNSSNGGIRKKKRLGMGRPLRQLLPRK